MFKKLLTAAGVLACTATPSYAYTVVTQLGSAATFAAPSTAGFSSSATFNFNSAAVPAPFTAVYANASLVTGDTYSTAVPSPSTQLSAEPGFSDGSQYLAVRANGTATIANTTTGYSLVSLFLGSIDTYNTVELLSSTGTVLATFTGSMFTTPVAANGDQDASSTNRRVSFGLSAGDALIYGVRISSSANAAEVDNLVFAVPEPSTWMMMLLGFGMIGTAVRARRRRTNVVFA